VNGDNKLDLIAGGPALRPRLYLGTGAGTFQLAGEVPVANDGAMEFFDLNGDKVLDLVSSAGVQLGNGNGTFQQHVLKYVGAGPAIVSLAIADYDRDGKLDIAWPDPVNNAVHALLGRGDGTFGDPRAQPHVASDTDVTLVAPRAVRIADLDGDGRGDVLMASAP